MKVIKMKEIEEISFVPCEHSVIFNHRGQQYSLDHDGCCVNILSNGSYTFVIMKDYIEEMIRCVIYENELVGDSTLTRNEAHQVIGPDFLDLTAEYLCGLFFASYSIGGMS